MTFYTLTAANYHSIAIYVASYSHVQHYAITHNTCKSLNVDVNYNSKLYECTTKNELL